MASIEFVNGQESHSSYWGKFYVKGLEAYQVAEDFEENQKDNHHSYQGYVCLDVPENKVFTLFYQDGDKRGTDTSWFLILVADDSVVNEIASPYGSGKISGNFRVLVEAKTKTKAPRLMGWWIDSKDKSLEFAQHCGQYINKRGIKELPVLVK